MGSRHLAGVCSLFFLPCGQILFQDLSPVVPVESCPAEFPNHWNNSKASANLQGWKLPLFDELQIPSVPPEARVGVNMCVYVEGGGVLTG